MDIQSSIQDLQLKLFPLGVPYDVVPTALQSLELEEVPARYDGTSPLEKTYKQVTPYFNKYMCSFLVTKHRYVCLYQLHSNRDQFVAIIHLQEVYDFHKNKWIGEHQLIMDYSLRLEI
jgi:hypothetical protein